MRTEGADLRREAQSFTLFLVSRLPNAEVVEKYYQAHQSNRIYSRGDRFDHWMVRTARAGPSLTWLLDAYARVLRPRGLLRHKLVLVHALLETTTPFFELLEQIPQRTPAVALLALIRTLTTALLGLAGGLVLGLPVHLFYLAWPRRNS